MWVSQAAGIRPNGNFLPMTAVGSGVVQNQPGALPHQGQWMSPPKVPNGLDYLTSVDQILCHQKIVKSSINWFDVFDCCFFDCCLSWQNNNQYTLKTSTGEEIFHCFEKTNCCTRQLCKHRRPFTMHIRNSLQQEVMRVSRPLKFCGAHCCCACIDCCAYELYVESPVGQVIGIVRQKQACCDLKFEICDASGSIQLLLIGSACYCPCSDVDFLIYTRDQSLTIGKVTKEYSGFLMSVLKIDNFKITFPLDLDVKMKATLVGAAFLIDFILFE